MPEHSPRRAGPTVRRLAESPYLWIWVGSVALYAVMLGATPAAATPRSLAGMMPYVGMLALTTLGQAVVVLQRGMDFSMASILVLAGIVMAALTHAGMNAGPAALIAIAVGVGAGLVNGLLVSLLALSPLVATLAANGLYLGLSLLISGGVIIEAPRSLETFSRSKIVGLSVSFWIAVVAVVLLAILIRATAFGRRFIAAGSNPDAARAAGLRVTGYLLAAYAIAGGCFAGAGILIAGYIGGGRMGAGDSYLMTSVAALMLAGNSLAEGRLSLAASVGGALFMTMLSQFILALGAPASVQMLIQGLVLLVAVALPTIPRPRRRRARAVALT